MPRKLVCLLLLSGLMACAATKGASTVTRATQAITTSGPHYMVEVDGHGVGTAFAYAYVDTSGQERRVFLTAAHVVEKHAGTPRAMRLVDGNIGFPVEHVSVPNSDWDVAVLEAKRSDHTAITAVMRAQQYNNDDFVVAWNYSSYPPLIKNRKILSTGYLLYDSNNQNDALRFAALNIAGMGCSGAALLLRKDNGSCVGMVIERILDQNKSYQGIVYVVPIETIDQILLRGAASDSPRGLRD